MLAKLVDAPFSGEGWIFEPKLDGIRAIAYIRDGNVRLLSRRGLDLTDRYPGLKKALSDQKKNMILDGEIVALDEKGRPSFQLLQQRSGLSAKDKVERAEMEIPIVYYAFDILYVAGRQVTKLPLKERRETLKQDFKEDDLIKIVRDLGTDGVKAFDVCVHHGLEGVMAKRLNSTYQPGQRSGAWLKIKAQQSSEFLICGYTKGEGARSDRFGSLILGFHDENDQLAYAGRVGTGFDRKLLDELYRLMQPLRRKTSPFPRKIPDAAKSVWLTPKLVAEVKFAEWTRDGILRAPVFMHLREDIEPDAVERVSEVRVESGLETI